MKSKILIIGLPLFIVQLVIVYFITANILISQNQSKTDQPKVSKEEVNNNEKVNDEKSIDQNKSKENVTEKKNDNTATVSKYFHNLDDIISNPAESNGRILVLTSLSFDLASEKAKKILEDKNVILKDIVINNISRRTVPELNNPIKRDSLKIQIIKEVESKIPDVKINNLYFSKFIIQ